MESIEDYRAFLKATLWSEWGHIERDQAKGVPHPPLQKPVPQDAVRIDLVAPGDLSVGTMPLIEAINHRQSHRKFTEAPLTLEELSFLLWTSQGVHRVWREGLATRRTVPSAGSRHPFETYLLVYRVTGLEPGLYRYLALEHQLCLLGPAEVLNVPDQWFLHRCAVTFVWTVIPYRTEWRYSILSHKVIALDAGHICQNLYLSCAAIGAGTCAIGAYNQAEMDALLDVDGVDEFTIYVAPVGKI